MPCIVLFDDGMGSLSAYKAMLAPLQDPDVMHRDPVRLWYQQRGRRDKPPELFQGDRMLVSGQRLHQVA